MRLLRSFLDRIAPYFEKGQKLQKLYPLYEVIDSFFYTSKEVTTGACHVRDNIEFKRMMSTVLVALVPCVVMAMYNTGLQANMAMEELAGSAAAEFTPEAAGKVTGWRGAVVAVLGLGHDPASILDNMVYGALYFLPVYIVCFVVGVLWEILFAVVRKHDVNEGFFVTALLFPLTLPANIPLWQVALGITFGVVVAKEIFGGTGRNWLNPALAARAFLFFAYPQQISGDWTVWTAGNWSAWVGDWTKVDGFSGATPLATAVEGGWQGVTSQFYFVEAFWGRIPGCMGETSVLACLIGVAVLLFAGIASWRIMLSMLIGALALATLFYFNSEGSAYKMTSLPPQWHIVLGGFAFGLVFMATDPVTAAMTNVGQFIYGAFIGAVVILVRVVNPGYPEGTMLAILLGNAFAPLIDYYVVRANIRRRALRHA